jgi:2-desacetyl-2-hydroxyethyl bacteriochlorophyllide A dehydrogenase
MKGLVFTGLHNIELREVPKPELVDTGDVIIRITKTTICGSDLHFIHGIIPSTPGYVLGHEYTGVIERVGSSVKLFKPGDRVVGPPAPYCGCCENCKNGNYSHCINGSAARMHGGGVLPGTHSEYIRVPYADVCLHHIPDNLTDEQVLFIPDIISTAYSAVLRTKVKPGDDIVVYGAGPVGLCAVATAKLYSPKRIILVGRRDKFRLEMGKKVGATHLICATEQDVLGTIYDITEGKGANAAIDATGAEEAIQQAVKCVGVGGKVSLIGISGGNIEMPIPEIFFKNVILSMGLGDLTHIENLMGIIASGKLDISPLITHRMSLSEIETAFKLFEDHSKNAIKIVITP